MLSAAAYDNVTVLMVLLHGVEPVPAASAAAAAAAPAAAAAAAASSPSVQALAGAAEPAGPAATTVLQPAPEAAASASLPPVGFGLPPLYAVLPDTMPPVTIAPVSRPSAASSAGAAGGGAAAMRPSQQGMHSAAAVIVAAAVAAAAASSRAMQALGAAPPPRAAGRDAFAAAGWSVGAAADTAAPGQRDQERDVEMRDVAALAADALVTIDVAKPATSPKPVLSMTNHERGCPAMEWQTGELKKTQELKAQEPFKLKLQKQELQDVENCRDVLETGVCVVMGVGQEVGKGASTVGADAACNTWSGTGGTASGLELERAPEGQSCEGADKLQLACGRAPGVAAGARGGGDVGGGEWGCEDQAVVSERLLEASPSFHNQDCESV